MKISARAAWKVAIKKNIFVVCWSNAENPPAKWTILFGYNVNTTLIFIEDSEGIDIEVTCKIVFEF